MNESHPVNLPVARVVAPPTGSERWLLIGTLAGLLLIIALLVFVSLRRHQIVTITFPDGHGLQTGDPVRHRGIDVGRAIRVGLDPSLAHVVVTCELYPGSEMLAREGSQFWIVRPSVSLSGIEGLETIVGGRYLAVLPGPTAAARQTHFVGLQNSPGTGELVEGGLEILLEAPERFGLARGTPVYFRGMRVGEVVSVALSSDSLSVEASARIGPDYRSLVRDNSVFWKDSGVNFQLGLRGLNLDVGTLESLAAGGVAFATPDPPGVPAPSGSRFSIAPKEVDDWREWQPRLTVGEISLPNNLPLPKLLQAELTTSQRALVVGRRDVRVPVWLLVLGRDRIIAPMRLWELADPAADDNSPPRLAYGKEPLTVDPSLIEHVGGLGIMRQSTPLSDSVTRWPIKRLRAPAEPEDCLIVTGPTMMSLPLSQQRFTVTESTWIIDPSSAIPEDYWGAAVVSRRDGCVIGVIDFPNKQPAMIPIVAELFPSK